MADSYPNNRNGSTASPHVAVTTEPFDNSANPASPRSPSVVRQRVQSRWQSFMGASIVNLFMRRSALGSLDGAEEQDDQDDACSHDGTGNAPPSARHKQDHPCSSRKKRAHLHLAKTKWLRLDSHGSQTDVELEKLQLLMDLGLGSRDLRFLEPAAFSHSHPVILSRSKCIIVGIGFIKCIITKDHLLLFPDPANTQAVNEFLEDVKQRVTNFSTYAFMEKQMASNQLKSEGDAQATSFDPDMQLPFELKALEACLETTSFNCLVEVDELDATAYKVMDKMAKEVSPKHLDTVRRIKNRLVRCQQRVGPMREVLVQLLDDDKAMYMLNLSSRDQSPGQLQLPSQRRRYSTATSMPRALNRLPLHMSALFNMAGGRNASVLMPPMHPQSSVVMPGTAATAGTGQGETLQPSGHGARRASTASDAAMDTAGGGAVQQNPQQLMDAMQEEALEVEEAVAEVEMLLESYYRTFEECAERLQALDEYIKDTEDLVNTKLDQVRNRIIAVDLCFSSFMLSIGCMNAVSSIFGMNLTSGLETADYIFNIVSCIGSGGVIFMFMFMVWFGKRVGLFQVAGL